MKTVLSDRKIEPGTIAKNFVATGKWKRNHPNWKNKRVVEAWRKRIRKEWK